MSTNSIGTPVFLRDVATVRIGPEIRRGLAELDGKGEVAGGIVVVRFGENVLDVIERVKEKIKELEPTLPEGMRIVTTYDRSDLIHRSIDTLREEIIKLSVAVSAVCIVFLFHLPSALVVILTLPVAILISFICMYYLGLTSNIMSLSGIAIAVGAMVDASIIMVENAHKKLEEWEEQGRPGNRTEVIIEAAREVGPSLFFALLVISVGFLPVFTLQGQAGRLFKPLAYTKTFAMLFASFLAITLTPVLMTLFLRGKIQPEDKNPIIVFLGKLYKPRVAFALKYPKAVIAAAVIIMAMTVYPIMKLGSEFMPPLYEGTLFYMPVTVPAASISEVSQLLKLQDGILKKIPEVALVFGKGGRAETATDPAPLEMFETVINLKPEAEWRPGVTTDSLVNEMDKALQFPGVSNAWTMPIKARIDMLATGIRTPVGVKVLGEDLNVIEKLAREIEAVLKTVPGTSSAFAERIIGGYYLEIEPDRAQLARYGLMVGDLQQLIASAIGAETVTTTVEGRERYAVSLRYPRDVRSDPYAISREVLVPLSNGASVPLGQVADVKLTQGPATIRTENAQLAAYIFVDARDRDLGSYVADARRAVAEKVKFPPGYYAVWSGQFEYYERAKARLV